MHASPPYSRHDDAVSEVVGQILIFGILSTVLVLSLYTFNVAQDEAEERVSSATADSVAQRIAGLVVETALTAERHSGNVVTVQARLGLAERIEGHAYTVDLDSDIVKVTIPGRGLSEDANLFAAGAPSSVHVCDQSAIDGGPINVVATASPDPAICTVGPGVIAIYLEVTT